MYKKKITYNLIVVGNYTLRRVTGRPAMVAVPVTTRRASRIGAVSLAWNSNATTEPATTVRVVTPAGKLGYVPIASVLPIVTDQLCYIKDAGGWKIAGYAGG